MMMLHELRKDDVDIDKVEECLHEIVKLKGEYPDAFGTAMLFDDVKLQAAINRVREEEQ